MFHNQLGSSKGTGTSGTAQRPGRHSSLLILRLNR